MKKLIPIILIVMLIVNSFLLLTARDTKAQSKVTIKFWQAGGDANTTKKMAEIIKKFQNFYPNIKVQYQAIPWGEDPHNKFQTAIVSGTIADLLIVGSPFDHVLAGSDAIIPLDSYIDNALKKDMLEFAWKEGICYGKNEKLKGKIISLALYGSARTIIYNKEIFKEAGVPEPTKSWTLEEFKKYALKLTRDLNRDGKTDQYGFGTSARYASQYLPFIWDMGGEILNPEETKAAVENSPAWKKGLTFYLELLKKTSPPGSISADLSLIQKMFAEGKVAMYIDVPDFINGLLRTNPEWKNKIGIGQMPHNKRQTAFAGADVFVITKKSKFPNEAWKLMRFILRTDNQRDYCKVAGFLPSSKSAANDPFFTDDPINKGFFEALKCGKFYVKIDKSSAITTILRAEVQSAASGQKSIDQALKSIQKQIDQLLGS